MAKTTTKLDLPGAGTFLAVEGLESGCLGAILRAHGENRDGERCLKRRFGTVVTRVEVTGDAASSLSEVVVKEVPLPRRRWFAHRLGGRSRFCRDFEREERLLRLGILTPPLLACSLRPAGRVEFQVTRFIESGRTLRQLLWFGDGALAEREERERLLGVVGRWVRRLHDLGVWQRDFKAHNILARRWQAEPPELFLLDITPVRFLGGPLDERRRIRNLGQLLDVPARLDDEAPRPLLAAYLEDRASALEAWLPRVRRVVERRRGHRLQQDGFRYIDDRVLSKN